MNQFPPPFPDQPESDPSHEEQTTTENPQSESTERNFDGFSKSVRDAVETGKKDAKKLFDDALPRVKEDVSKGVHDVAYALAFAGAFAGALIREVAPDSLVDGLREGASAGQRAAEEAVRNQRERKTAEPETPENEVGSVPA